MSKRKIEQEVDLVLLFELFSIGKRITEQSNRHIFNEYRNWSGINQSYCTTHDRKLAQFSQTVYISRSEDSRRKHSEGLRVIFAEHSDVVENGILTMQRFLDIFRFLYSGGWQVWGAFHCIRFPS